MDYGDIFENAWNLYIERRLRSLVEELKKNNCLSQDFEFLPKAEFAQLFLDVFDELDEG